jgi:hypothetical protein
MFGFDSHTLPPSLLRVSCACRDVLLAFRRVLLAYPLASAVNLAAQTTGNDPSPPVHLTSNIISEFCICCVSLRCAEVPTGTPSRGVNESAY